MKIMYVAPSFHPNQAPIMKGWVQNGDKVTFISQYLGPTEDHSYCSPIILGYSGLFVVLNRAYAWIQKRKRTRTAYPEAFQNKCGFPPYFRLKKIIVQVRPDLVIVRERCLYSMVAYHICKVKNIPCILYNQTPLWDKTPPKTDVPHRIIKSLTPPLRMTPVYGDSKNGYLDPNAQYIPFVIEPKLNPENKVYFQNQEIHILCVGKFEVRKHHLMLLDVFSRLERNYPLKLTLVGEVSTPNHQIYLKKVHEYIDRHNLHKKVDIHYNCKTGDMPLFYENADLFVLPSTGEFASVSQLEAMSYSLPVIVSDTNGTACYVENGENGYLFRDKDVADLEAKITDMLRDLDRLKQMGARSYELVQTKYAFSGYMDKLKQLSQEK